MTKLELIAALEAAPDKGVAFLGFNGSELGSHVFKRGMTANESMEMFMQDKGMDDGGLTIAEALKLLSSTDDDLEQLDNSNVVAIPTDLVMWASDDDCQMQLSLPIHAKIYPEGRISTEGAIFETLPTGTPILIIGETGYISIPADEFGEVEYETEVTVGEVLEDLRKSPSGPIYVSLLGGEHTYDTFARFMGGGALVIEASYEDDTLNDKQSIEEAILMLENDNTETRITLYIDPDFNDFLEIGGEVWFETNTTSEDANIVIVDEEQGLDFIYGEPDEELKQQLIEPIDKGFVYFTALFLTEA